MITFRCPMCHEGNLLLGFTSQPEIALIENAISCKRCNTTFPTIRGLPFLATFHSEDIVRLGETLAHPEGARLRIVTNSSGSATASYVENLYSTLQNIRMGMDEKDALQLGGFDEIPWWWSNRQSEFDMFCWVTNGLNFVDKIVVDVGAGSGTDSMLFYGLGAKVVAIEPDFVSLVEGASSYPKLQWLGAVAEALPLSSEQADYVVANASLHHHLNIAESIPEMLRVLRVGGCLLTMGDPFKSHSSHSLEEDWTQFDTHAFVLRGINEQIIRLDNLLSILTGFGDALEVRVFLDIAQKPAKTEMTLAEAISFTGEGPLSWGSVALCVKKLKPIVYASKLLAQGPFLSAELLKAVVQNEENLFHFVDTLVKEEHLTNSLFDTQQDRWLQLNGWRKLQTQHPGLRFAYSKGRVFLKRPDRPGSYLNIEWMVPDCAKSADFEIELRLNGNILQRSLEFRGVWHTWSFPVIENVTFEKHLCVELFLVQNDWPKDLSLLPENHIAVRQLFVDSLPLAETQDLSPEPSLRALFKSFTGNIVPCVICGADVNSAMLALRKIKEISQQKTIFIITSRWQKSFFSSIPWLSIVGEHDQSVINFSSQSDVVFIMAGFARDSVFPQLPKSHPKPATWWLDLQGHPLAISDLEKLALRDSLCGLRDGESPIVSSQMAKAPDSSKLATTREKLAVTRRQLATTREKLLKQREKVAALKEKGISNKRPGWITRLLTQKKRH